MTKERETLTLALEALNHLQPTALTSFYTIGDRDKAITAIKEALAQPEQEPVARVIDNGTPEGATEWIPFTNRVEPLETGDLLYTTPPLRQPLTLDAISKLIDNCKANVQNEFLVELIRAAEAAHNIGGK